MKKALLIILLSTAFISNAQTSKQVFAELKRQNIPHAEIVLAQARLETGNFSSKLCKTKHNIFGIKHGKQYASYRRWEDCVTDYKRRISIRYKGGDYYAFLQKIGYASDPRYIKKLKQFK